MASQNLLPSLSLLRFLTIESYSIFLYLLQSDKVFLFLITIINISQHVSETTIKLQLLERLPPNLLHSQTQPIGKEHVSSYWGWYECDCPIQGNALSAYTQETYHESVWTSSDEARKTACLHRWNAQGSRGQAHQDWKHQAYHQGQLNRHTTITSWVLHPTTTQGFHLHLQPLRHQTQMPSIHSKPRPRGEGRRQPLLLSGRGEQRLTGSEVAVEKRRMVSNKYLWW